MKWMIASDIHGSAYYGNELLLAGHFLVHDIKYLPATAAGLPFPSYMPVSYTHLDVYKRQG